MAILEIKNQVEEGLGKLMTQWKDKPVVVGLLTSYLENVQQVEDVLFDLLEKRSLETAVGVYLDALGLLVGELRKGKLDDEYRRAVKLRIAINKSDGTEPVIRELIKELTNADIVNIVDTYPAAVSLLLEGEDVFVDQELVNEISNILAATISAEIKTTVLVNPPFVFENDESGSGFSDASQNSTFTLITNTGAAISTDLGDILTVKNTGIYIDPELQDGGYLSDVQTIFIT
jgi:hypothetical protein